ncbi:hypothetical protein GGE07_005232 [Sinorhizobium terangae]|nr:hypothetical protein [Sinorhizobium terangae]
MTVMPIGAEPSLRARRLNFLATSSAEEMIRRCPRTAMLLPELADAIAVQKAAEPSRLFDITDYPDDDKELITQTLGEGEVAGVAALSNRTTAQMQEAVMAGVWRIRFTDAEGRLVARSGKSSPASPLPTFRRIGAARIATRFDQSS